MLCGSALACFDFAPDVLLQLLPEASAPLPHALTSPRPRVPRHLSLARWPCTPPSLPPREGICRSARAGLGGAPITRGHPATTASTLPLECSMMVEPFTLRSPMHAAHLASSLEPNALAWGIRSESSDPRGPRHQADVFAEEAQPGPPGMGDERAETQQLVRTRGWRSRAGGPGGSVEEEPELQGEAVRQWCPQTEQLPQVGASCLPTSRSQRAPSADPRDQARPASTQRVPSCISTSRNRGGAQAGSARRTPVGITGGYCHLPSIGCTAGTTQDVQKTQAHPAGFTVQPDATSGSRSKRL
uniref:Uncharacterized protein n=1 Tax=Rangifer tarandus platyrhynchus TaxID=3082113 RepID=A0ACB0EJ52_RANTA|nr:unnamed protein product [Rangifer tarandus platyrhynchus]